MNSPDRSPKFWHQRYRLQAGWTASLRTYILKQIKVRAGRRTLEVGCGTGAVLEEIRQTTRTHAYGVDIHFPSLQYAAATGGLSSYLQGNGLALPFPSHSFNLVFCHFFLLWVSDPPGALAEMVRVTSRGGIVAALAEPDYGGRIDYPKTLAEIGRLQDESLKEQGADTRMGRKLKSLFNQAGLREVHTGVLGGEWSTAPGSQAWESEWQTLAYDLGDKIDASALRTYRNLDAIAWQTQERILYVPTFYAWGRVDQ